MVGDYMFDATLNGVMDSADSGTDIILSEILTRRRALSMQQAGTIGSGNWSKAASIEEVLEHLFPVEALVDMLSIVWV